MNSHQQFHQNTQFGSGLTRYSSAPSSYFATLLSDDGGFGDDDFAQLFNPRASSPETQRIFSRFMNGTGSIQETCHSNMAVNSHFPASLSPRISETEDCQPPPQQQRTDYSSESQMMYANHNSEAANDSSSVERSFVSFKSYSAQPKMELPPTSSLIRHSSSPAGLFANINIEIDFKRMRGSYGDYSSSGMMEPISELGSKGMGENAADDDAQFREDNDVVDYITGLPVNAWDDSSLMSDHHLKGSADNESSGFFKANASDDQKNEAPNRPKTQLSHHLSLPKSSAELAAMEKLLQDSVPCKIRAKRGFATHPRSIAERVRRTKISERMRKLQELVPNMEKQTNTSDMLDLAVEYIKELQRQIKTLSDDQANCKCSAKQRS